MKSRSKKLHKSSENVVAGDRLSELPTEVLVHILSFLPTPEAVRTVLLRTFGKLWTLVPSLSFQSREISWSDDTFQSFTLFVRNVLMLHKRLTIDKFDVYLDSDVDYETGISKIDDDVKMWLRFALDREVTTLTLEIDDNLSDICGSVLPRSLFTSQSLVKLELRGCRIEPQDHIHMDSLKKLLVYDAYVNDATFEELISGCPSLEELHICSLNELQSLHFTSPSIEMLHLIMEDSPNVLDCPNLKYLQLEVYEVLPEVIDVSSLCEVNIEMWHFRVGVTSNKFKIFVEKFQHVEFFTLSFADFYPYHLKESSFPKNTWKCLDLCLGDYENCLMAICKWVRNSEHVEELIIRTNKERLESSCDLLKSELATPHVMPKLKTVTMNGYEFPFEGQLQLVEYLLKGAIALEELVIVRGDHKLTAVQELEFVTLLSSFRRASTNARIVFA